MKKVILLVVCLLFSFPLFSQPSDKIKEQAFIYREKGYELQEKGELRPAAVCYQKALQLDPDYAEAYNDLGVVLESMGNKDAAVENYQKALQCDSEYLPAYSNLAFIYEEKEDWEKASYYWKKRYQLSKKGDYWYYQAMKHLVALGTYPEIQKEMLAHQVAECYQELSSKREQAREARCEEARGYLQRGRKLVLNKEYAQAIKVLRSGLDVNQPDKKLAAEISEEYVRAQKLAVKEDLNGYMKQALIDVEKEDYKTAVANIKEALALIFTIEH